MANNNENIHHINCIEGLISEICARIELIRPMNNLAQIAKEQALTDMNDFQVGTLHDLRILCEGD